MTKENVAIKIEERSNKKTTLEREAFILYYLRGPGLPEVKSFGKTKKYNILAKSKKTIDIPKDPKTKIKPPLQK